MVPNSVASILYPPVSGSGNPAFGLAINGKCVKLANSFIRGKISTGPREQFIPMASTPSPCNVKAIFSIPHPVNVLPFSSNVIVTNTGKFVCSFAASTAAFTSYKSVMVSKITKSAPASSPATTISRNTSYASSNFNVPDGSNNSPIGPTSNATFA